MDRTRRGLLGLLAVTTGCLGFGGDNEVTPREVTDSPATQTASPTSTNSPTPAGSSTPTETPTQSSTETESPTATESPTTTPTPTPRDAQAPPPGSLALLGRQISVRPIDGGIADVSVRLANTGEEGVAFRVVEIRFDLSYESPFTGQSEVVASGVFERRFDDDLLGPGNQAQIGGRLTLRSLDGTESDRRFSLDVAYRRVVY